MGFGRQQLRLLIIVSGLIAPFMFLSSSMQPNRTNQTIFVIWQYLLYPVEQLLHNTKSSVLDALEVYVSLKNTARQNIELRQTIRQLKSKVMDYDHQVHETQRLRKMLGFSNRFKNETVLGEIIGSTIGPGFQSIRIGKGDVDNLSIGMAAVSSEGVVGRIIRVGHRYSDIQLISDTNFNMDVLIERTRMRGILSGYHSGKCRLKLHRRADVKIGDSIITSGISGSFPKGLPVGRVVRITHETKSVSQVITIQPAVDYHVVEEVLILRQLDRQIEMILQKAPSSWLQETLGSLPEPQSRG